MLTALEKLARFTSSATKYQSKTTSRVKIAQSFLVSPDNRTATALLMALRTLCGAGVLSWEPESIWLTLERDFKIDLDEVARNKIQASITLIVNPAFFWDNLVFQRTTQALNGELFDPESLQECHPAHMNWAVYEAQIIRGHDPEEDEELQSTPLELDEDVQQYVAVCLHRAGYVYPPPKLLPVADNLARLFPADGQAFVRDVKKRWEHINKGVLLDRTYQENPLGIQLSKLAACAVYATERAQVLAEDVLVLEKEISL
jgi:hypothetical protein